MYHFFHVLINLGRTILDPAMADTCKRRGSKHKGKILFDTDICDSSYLFSRHTCIFLELHYRISDPTLFYRYFC